MRPYSLVRALLVASAAWPASACHDTADDGELSAAAIESRVELSSIATEEAYEAMAVEGGGFGQAGRSMKFLVDARDPEHKNVHFINGNYAVGGKTPEFVKYHYLFAQHQLQIPESNEEFNRATYFTNDKRYYAGTIQTYQLEKGKAPIYAVQLYPDDVIHEGGILELVRTIHAAFDIPGARMAFVAGGPQQSFATVAGDLAKLGYEAMTIEQVLGSVNYLPVNPGEAHGYLRLFPKDAGELRPSDIVVFDELPLDLSVVAGTITRVFQDVTSHVNLKAKERGTPNMVLRDAPTNTELAPLKDQPVHVVVGKTGYTIERSTKEIVDQKLAERMNRPWVALPRVDERNVVRFDDMCPRLSPSCMENGGRFGGKAANLGFLANRDVLGRRNQPGSRSARAGYDLVPWGFGVPVTFYRDFVSAPENAEIRAKLDVLIAKEKSGNLSPNERRALAADVQQAFYRGKIPAAQLAAVGAQLQELRRVVPGVDKIKVRSSANAEDIPNFDGAGLHDSFAAKLSAQDNPDLSCALDASKDGVVTKLEMKPKTVQCAIKGVFASLWNPRALEERSFARIDHATAGMGLAVLPAYDTESDVSANGVVITRAVNSDLLAYTLGIQRGNDLVTNPEPGTIAQTTLATFAGASEPTRFTLTRFATPVAGQPPLKESVLPEAQLNQIVELAKSVEVAYCRVKRGYFDGDCRDVWLDERKPSSLDLEFKLLQNGQFVIKQTREFHGQ